MKNLLLVLSILSISLHISCTQTQQSTEKAVENMASPKVDLLDPTFDAHGGLEKWKAMRSLSFELTSSNGDKMGSPTQYVLNLQTRHEKITGEDYMMGYDGKEYWQKLMKEGMKDKNPKFYTNLQFYFFAMPWVFADPGVNKEKLGMKRIKDQEFEVVKITFGSDVGVAPKDQYIVYLDPSSHQLVYMLYSVTYFNEENAEKYGALHYAEWEKVEGLLVPKRADRYKWDSEKQALGESRGSKHFSKIEFNQTAPDPSVFSKPE